MLSSALKNIGISIPAFREEGDVGTDIRIGVRLNFNPRLP